jgi:Ser/Thr protein kinase RdoA (MazF antagonist)
VPPAERPFDEPAARAVLAAAVQVTGLDVAGARLIRLGSNAVFELPAALGGTVARVTPPHPDAGAVRRCLAVTAWLATEGFPAVRAVPDEALGVVQPVAFSDHLVTFWRSLGPVDRAEARPGTTRELGELLRAFHALTPPPERGTTPFPSPPPMDPVGRARRQLPLAPLPPPDRSFLLDRLADVATGYEALTFPLGEGLLHGDATVANVVHDRDGRATLIDFDLVRTGPREWDLLRTATYHRRLGWHTAAEYRDFCDGYGVDVTAWPGFDVTADLAELLQVAWLAEAASRRPVLAAELRTRLDTLRTGGSRHSWRAV